MTSTNGSAADAAAQAPLSPTVSTVALKLPCFWPADPALWFAQVEAQFATRRITSQQTKFHHVIAALNPTEAAEVRDIILSPPADQPFDRLKLELVRRTTLSEQKRLQQLLTAEDLGDRKPSQLLRGMRQLLGEKASTVDDSLLRQLFLQRLPANVCMVLAGAGDMTLDDLAALADRVMEVASPSISAIDSSVQAFPAANEVKNLVSFTEFRALRDEVQRIAQALATLEKPRPRRPRSFSRPRGSSRAPESTGVCWYHHRFGDNATKCVPPCAQQGNTRATH